MNTYINEISKMMKDAGLDGIDFLYERRRYTIQAKGIRYEILTIWSPEDGDDELMLTTIPSYGWSLVHLYVGESWPERTWEKLTKIVREYVQSRES